MASRVEQRVSRSLRAILADLPNDGSTDSQQFQEVLCTTTTALSTCRSKSSGNRGPCHMNAKVFFRAFQSLYGQPCWGLRHGRYSNLLMNFGRPSLHVREPFNTNSESEPVQRMAARRQVTVRGEWRLSLFCCYWRLSANGLHQLASGSSSFRRIERAIAELNGQELVSVEVEPATGATRFAFDLGCVLDCRRFERDTEDPLWLLYKPSGYVLSVHGNGTFSHQRGTQVEKCLQPIEEVRSQNGEVARRMRRQPS